MRGASQDMPAQWWGEDLIGAREGGDMDDLEKNINR